MPNEHRIVDLGQIKELAARLAGMARPGEPLWVVGSAGSGRTALTHELVDQHGAVAVWALDPADAFEAASHAVVQAASGISDRDARQRLAEHTDPGDGASKVATALAGEGRLLVLRLTPGWTAESSQAQTAGQALSLRAADAVRRAWTFATEVRLVIITDRAADPTRLGPWCQAPSERLHPPELRADALLDAEAWGSLATSAALLHELHRAADAGPISTRMAVAALSLSVAPETVSTAMMRPSEPQRIVELVPFLVNGVAMRPRLRETLRRLLALRVPLPLDHLEHIADEHTDLIGKGLGYGSTELRFSRQLSTALRPRVGHTTQDDRVSLLHTCQELDGQPAHWQTKAVRWWLEKHHQALYAGEEGRNVWAAGEPYFPGPAWYWERARALSLAGEFEAAAEIYARGLDRFGQDSYGWHYLGFNLAKAGVDRQRAERALRCAVSLDESNPWWNSRLVTFFISQGRFSEADAAWAEALRQLDPDGDRAAKDPWLVENVHAWVADAWLEAGEPLRALEALAGVPDEFFDKQVSQRLAKLRHRIADAAEAESIGTSVYPAHVSMDQRWVGPRLAGPLLTNRLDAWFPGRVIAVESEWVQVVYAVPSENRSVPRVVRSRFGADRWRELTGQDASTTDVDTFLELYRLCDGEKRILLDAATPPSAEDREEFASSYLERWASPTPAS